MAQFTIYKSTDTSAPVLTGTIGDLVNLLDKCLVAGYGSKSAAGWTKPFTGTNKACFQQGSGSNSMYLRVQDDAPGAGGAKEARMTGYETMSAVDTGTGPFPTAAQGVGAVAMHVCRKSATADATSRTWIVAADSRTFYLFVLTGDTALSYLCFAFGEFYSLLSSDAYRCMLIGRSAENSAVLTQERVGLLSALTSTTSGGHFFARGHTGTGGSVLFSATGDEAKHGGVSGLVGSVPYTNPADGGLYVSPIWISDPTTTPVNGLRGRYRGFWHFLHAATSVADGDTVTGVGDLSGKTFLFIRNIPDNTGAAGVAAIETSNTLESN